MRRGSSSLLLLTFEKFYNYPSCGNSSVGRAQPCRKKNEVFNLGKEFHQDEYNAEIAQLVEHNLAAKKNEFFNLGKEFYQDEYNAEIAQLVEHNLAKVGVAGPSPVFRS